MKNRALKQARRRVTLSLNPDQFRELEILMEEDGQTNFTFYIVFLILQEKKRRMEGIKTAKNPVGRPKTTVEAEDLNFYPAPYKGGAPYKRVDLEAYYDFRKEVMPPLPKPLTAEEIKKYE